jgi:hypothetical protein
VNHSLKEWESKQLREKVTVSTNFILKATPEAKTAPASMHYQVGERINVLIFNKLIMFNRKIKKGSYF